MDPRRLVRARGDADALSDGIGAGESEDELHARATTALDHALGLERVEHVVQLLG